MWSILHIMSYKRPYNVTTELLQINSELTLAAFVLNTIVSSNIHIRGGVIESVQHRTNLRLVPHVIGEYHSHIDGPVFYVYGHNQLIAVRVLGEALTIQHDLLVDERVLKDSWVSQLLARLLNQDALWWNRVIIRLHYTRCRDSELKWNNKIHNKNIKKFPVFTGHFPSKLVKYTQHA